MIRNRENTHPETERGAVGNPRIAAVLGSVGVTAVDLQTFDNLRQRGFSIFTHGSIVRGRVTPKSDVDFSVIGSLETMPPDLKDTILPGFAATESLRRVVDYMSTAIYSQKNRKMSLHISEPDFRRNYPVLDHPFATEFRPGTHQKSGERNYFLAGTDAHRGIYLANFVCESQPVGDEGATTTDTPQTGRMVLEGSTVKVDGVAKADVRLDNVIYISPNGKVDPAPHDLHEEVLFLGLEYDKMLTDTAVYADDAARVELVEGPLRRSMEAVGDYTKTDPATITSEMYSQLSEHWSTVKKDKTR